MINEHHEFELDGVLYKGRMVGDQDPLIEEWDPLRPQNAQLVQGEANTVFNMRPDVLVFKWTDWSGGEGQFSFDPQQPGRYYRGQSINPFQVPGTLRAGPAVKTMGLHATPDTPLEITSAWGWLVRRGSLVSLVANNKVYITVPAFNGWVEEESSITGQTGEILGVAADSRWLWILDDDSVIRLDGSGTFEDFATGISGQGATLLQLGNYLYMVRTVGISTTVTEWGKTAAIPVAGTTIFTTNLPHDVNVSNMHKLTTASGNRIYSCLVDSGKTYIVEITPTSAAGAGSGAVIGMVPVEAVSMVWSGGLLYLHVFPEGVPAFDRVAKDQGVLLYFNPEDGTYGIVDTIGPGKTMPYEAGNFGAHSTQEGGQALTENMFTVMFNDTVGENAIMLMVHDATQGALHTYARLDNYLPGGWPGQIVRFQEHVMILENNYLSQGGNPGVVHALKPTTYEGEHHDPYAISSAWDFGLVDAKVLSSLRVSTETVPQGWTIHVDYDVDESGSWASAGTVSSGTEGSTLFVTDGVDTVYFRLLRLRVRFVYTGIDLPPTTTPVLLGIEARAQVTEKLNTWTLMIELTDDQAQAGPQSRTGGQKIDAVEALAGSSAGAVVFKNGITHRDPGKFDTYNVLVDSARLFLSRPGEGYAIVRLVEVA